MQCSVLVYTHFEQEIMKKNTEQQRKTIIAIHIIKQVIYTSLVIKYIVLSI